MTDTLFDFPYLVFDLEMTPSGFERFIAELAGHDKRESQIYIHVRAEGALADKAVCSRCS